MIVQVDSDKLVIVTWLYPAKACGFLELKAILILISMVLIEFEIELRRWKL